MRSREKILASLESVYRDAFARAEAEKDAEAMARLDFEFQQEQIRLEVLLDIRELLRSEPSQSVEPEPSILERAEALRRIARLR